jgi:hypothetical protein
MSDRPVFDYYAAPSSIWRPPWWLAFVWVSVSAIVWRTSDWWVYITHTPPQRKFELPLRFQLAVSAAEGLLAAVACYGVVVAVRWLRRRSVAAHPR